MSYSSGQRGQTVNLLTLSSVVRIHDSPPLHRLALCELGMNGSRDSLLLLSDAGIAQLARASAFQAEGRGFEPRFPLHLLGADSFIVKYADVGMSTPLCYFRESDPFYVVVFVAHIAQWQSTSLVRKRSAVQPRLWAPVFLVERILKLFEMHS